MRASSAETDAECLQKAPLHRFMRTTRIASTPRRVRHGRRFRKGLKRRENNFVAILKRFVMRRGREQPWATHTQRCRGSNARQICMWQSIVENIVENMCGHRGPWPCHAPPGTDPFPNRFIYSNVDAPKSAQERCPSQRIHCAITGMRPLATALADGGSDSGCGMCASSDDKAKGSSTRDGPMYPSDSSDAVVVVLLLARPPVWLTLFLGPAGSGRHRPGLLLHACTQLLLEGSWGRIASVDNRLLYT